MGLVKVESRLSSATYSWYDFGIVLFFFLSSLNANVCLHVFLFGKSFDLEGYNSAAITTKRCHCVGLSIFGVKLEDVI